mmetsp:Transcript_13790/g.25855  ORF Transcript_13790/g.25855 Transcript_13790/m.25855 type:complete len:164 (+) Transcript_13790:75-566(+)
MSRHAYGPTWHQGPMNPVWHGNNAGEAFPKLVPSHGCFRGVPGDVPPSKQLWYMKGVGMETAGTSSLTGRGRESGNFSFKSTGVMELSHRSGMSQSASSPNLAGSARLQESALLPVQPPGVEKSHAALHYGRNRLMPETLQTAGLSTFLMRRYQETTSALAYV